MRHQAKLKHFNVFSPGYFLLCLNDYMLETHLGLA